MWPIFPRPLVECWPIWCNPTMPKRQTPKSQKCHHHFPISSPLVKRQMPAFPRLMDTSIIKDQYSNKSPWLLVNIHHWVHDQPKSSDWNLWFPSILDHHDFQNFPDLGKYNLFFIDSPAVYPMIAAPQGPRPIALRSIWAVPRSYAAHSARLGPPWAGLGHLAPRKMIERCKSVSQIQRLKWWRLLRVLDIQEIPATLENHDRTRFNLRQRPEKGVPRRKRHSWRETRTLVK